MDINHAYREVIGYAYLHLDNCYLIESIKILETLRSASCATLTLEQTPLELIIAYQRLKNNRQMILVIRQILKINEITVELLSIRDAFQEHGFNPMIRKHVRRVDILTQFLADAFQKLHETFDQDIIKSWNKIALEVTPEYDPVQIINKHRPKSIDIDRKLNRARRMFPSDSPFQESIDNLEFMCDQFSGEIYNPQAQVQLPDNQVPNMNEKIMARCFSLFQ